MSTANCIAGADAVPLPPPEVVAQPARTRAAPIDKSLFPFITTPSRFTVPPDKIVYVHRQKRVTSLFKAAPRLVPVPSRNRPLLFRIGIDRYSEPDLPNPELDLPKSELDLPKSELDLPNSESDLPKSKLDLPKSKLDLPNSESDLPKSKLDLPTSKLDLPNSEPDLPSRGLCLHTKGPPALTVEKDCRLRGRNEKKKPY
jgi:hypothetical protein